MKVLCFSFIVHLVLILTQPCQDLVAVVDASERNQTQFAYIDCPSQTDAEREECLPFCICSCCGQPAAARHFSFAITPELVGVVIPTTLSEYTDPYAANYHDSIWQPPKV